MLALEDGAELGPEAIREAACSISPSSFGWMPFSIVRAERSAAPTNSGIAGRAFKRD